MSVVGINYVRRKFVLLIWETLFQLNLIINFINLFLISELEFITQYNYIIINEFNMNGITSRCIRIKNISQRHFYTFDTTHNYVVQNMRFSLSSKTKHISASSKPKLTVKFVWRSLSKKQSPKILTNIKFKIKFVWPFATNS